MSVLLLTIVIGCGQKDGRVGASGKAVKSTIGLKSGSLEVGTLQQAHEFRVVKVPIRNLGNSPLDLVDGRISCTCMRMVKPLKQIEPFGKAEFEFGLDCRTVGPKTASYSFSSSDSQHAEITLSWIVVDGVTVEPTFISDIDLFNGANAATKLKVSTMQENLRVQIIPRRATESLQVSAQLENGVCEVNFTASVGASPEIESGEICFFKAGQKSPIAAVPYIVRVHNSIEISPRMLYFNERDGRYHAQLVIQNTPELVKGEIQITWRDEEEDGRSYKVEQVAENLHIVDIMTDSNASDNSHLLLHFGSETREVPVFFEASKPQ